MRALIVFKAPPPMLEEILSTFAAQADGDKDLLAAILRAKEAEELVSCMPTPYHTLKPTKLFHVPAHRGGGGITANHSPTPAHLGTSIWHAAS